MIASYSLFIVDIGLKAKLSVDNRVRSCSPPHQGYYGLVSSLESCEKHWAKKQHQCPEKFGEAAQMLLPRGVRRGWKRFWSGRRVVTVVASRSMCRAILAIYWLWFCGIEQKPWFILVYLFGDEPQPSWFCSKVTEQRRNPPCRAHASCSCLGSSFCLSKLHSHCQINNATNHVAVEYHESLPHFTALYKFVGLLRTEHVCTNQLLVLHGSSSQDVFVSFHSMCSMGLQHTTAHSWRVICMCVCDNVSLYPITNNVFGRQVCSPLNRHIFNKFWIFLSPASAVSCPKAALLSLSRSTAGVIDCRPWCWNCGSRKCFYTVQPVDPV